MSFTDQALEEVRKERDRQIQLAHGGDTDSFDKTNSMNDWIAYIAAYAGRGADKALINEKDGYEFRKCMIKTAALAVAAIEAHDKGYLD